MRWLRRDIWKAGIALAGMLLLLVLMAWIPVAAAGAYEGVSGLATPGTVQATPTVDATVTALSKEQLTLQVKQLQNQLQNQNNWVVNNSTALIAAVASVVVALFGILQWAITARQAKDKDLKAQAEERFKTAVSALGEEKEGVQVGGAILLRSFLNKDDKKSYERYYTQIFDLAVAYLRPPTEDPDGIPHSPEDPNTPLPLTTLRQALIVVFKEAFPLARGWIKKRQTLESSFLQRIKARLKRTLRGEKPFEPQLLDASRIQLDNAYLVNTDLKQAFLRKAFLNGAHLNGAHLNAANLRKAYLHKVFLSWAHLHKANLSMADLTGANLIGADLTGANLIEADLRKALLGKAVLYEAELLGADLSGTDLSGADLRKATYNKKMIPIGTHDIKPTQWPVGFDPDAAGAILRDTLSFPKLNL